MKEVSSRRLDSWKEIADYLDRDIRTVIRWEKTKELPVHRVPGGQRQSVFAYTAEIDGWLHGRALDSQEEVAVPENGSRIGTSGSNGKSLQIAPATASADSRHLPEAAGAAAEIPQEAIPALPALRPAAKAPWVTAAIIAVLAALVAGAGWWLAHRPGAPVRVSLAGKRLIAWDNQNQAAWQYEFPQPVELRRVPGSDSVLFADLSGDGSREILVLLDLILENATPTHPLPLEPGKFPQSALYCFSENGRLLWKYQPDLKLSFAGHSFEGPWHTTDMILTPAGRGRAVWMSFGHHTWWPNYVVRLDALRGSTLALVNSGAVLTLGYLKNTTGGYVLAAGMNNGYNSAMLAVLGENAAPAASPQEPNTPYLYDGTHDPPYRYFLLPRSELFQLGGNSFHLATSLVIEPDRFQVHTFEGRDPNGNGRYLEGFYEFTKDFDLVSASLGDAYWELHRQMEKQGKIHHAAAQCPDRLMAKRVLELLPDFGWVTPKPPAERAAN
jgi:hypothetical protein